MVCISRLVSCFGTFVVNECRQSNVVSPLQVPRRRSRRWDYTGKQQPDPMPRTTCCTVRFDTNRARKKKSPAQPHTRQRCGLQNSKQSVLQMQDVESATHAGECHKWDPSEKGGGEDLMKKQGLKQKKTILVFSCQVSLKSCFADGLAHRIASHHPPSHGPELGRPDMRIASCSRPLPARESAEVGGGLPAHFNCQPCQLSSRPRRRPEAFSCHRMSRPRINTW